MLNSIILVGRLTKDPELRKTGNGNSIAKFDLAVDNKLKNPDGTRGATFITAVCFQDIADNIVKYLRKGSKVGVAGYLHQRNFIRQDGSRGSTYEVVCDSVEFLDPKPEEDENPVFTDEDREEALASASGIPNEEVKELDLPDENLPFKGEESQPQKQPKFDPYTGKPLKPLKPSKK